MDLLSDKSTFEISNFCFEADPEWQIPKGVPIGGTATVNKRGWDFFG